MEVSGFYDFLKEKLSSFLERDIIRYLVCSAAIRIEGGSHR